MDQTTLVGPDIAAGQEALETLDGAGIKPIVALLTLLPEYGDWRFVLSSPALDQTHPSMAYEKVAQAFAGRFVYTLPGILVLPTKDPFIREIRRIFGKVKDATGMRLSGQRIGNRFIDTGYVYRVQ